MKLLSIVELYVEHRRRLQICPALKHFPLRERKRKLFVVTHPTLGDYRRGISFIFARLKIKGKDHKIDYFTRLCQ